MLLAPSNPPERMSQLLPTVKCSSCDQPVALSDLGEHVCAGKPAPSQPQSAAAALTKTSISQTSSLSSLPQRLHSLVSSKSPPPPSSSPARSSKSPPASKSNSNSHGRYLSTSTNTSSGSGGSSYSDSRSNASSFTSGLSIPPVPGDKDGRLRSLSTASSSTSSSAPGRPSPLSSSGGVTRERKDSLPSQQGRASPFTRDRSMSNASSRESRPPMPSQSQSYAPPPMSMSMSTPPPLTPQQQRPPPLSSPGRPPMSPGPAGRPPMSPGPIMRPPMPPAQMQMGRPPMFPGPMGRPPMSPGPMGRPPMSPGPGPMGRPPMSPGPMGRPPMSPGPGPMARPPMSPGPMGRPPMAAGPPPRGPMTPQPMYQNPYDSMPGTPAPAPGNGPPIVQVPTSFNTPPAPAQSEDTKTGGEAGMAGVGRRGFAAVARAAMFVAFVPPDQNRGFHRANAPQALDINTNPNGLRPTETPPLSSSSEISPSSPYPQTPNAGSAPAPRALPSSLSPGLSPNRDQWQGPPTPVGAAAPSSPHLPFFDKLRTKLGSSDGSGSPTDDHATTPTNADTLKRSDSVSTYDDGVYSRRSPSPSNDGSESEIGLAYADSDADNDNESDAGAPPTAALRVNKDGADKRKSRTIRFTAASSSAYSRSSGGYFSGVPLGFGRDRDSHIGPGNLDRAIESVLEDVAKEKEEEKESPVQKSAEMDTIVENPTAGGIKAHRSNTLPNTSSPAESKPPKLPVRSKTEKERARDAPAAGSRKTRVCIRCDHTITDGKWIKVDGGGTLCEQCWKNMYLPKCRRCNLPIERQAVSSSDGQLKGKYHKECFNCNTCHKEFPDKTFYVYDGKPLCAYHYHEANKSLCAAPDCGEPIEGPCAVSHSGERYHPEHLLCEYSGYPECDERLVEYWEIDGRMLCEHHALAEQDGGDLDLLSKANKRMTRFIDLAAYGDEDSDEEAEALR